MSSVCLFLILPDGVISPHPVVSQGQATAARRTRCCWPRRAFLRPALPRCDRRSGGGGVRGCCWFAPQRPKLALGVGVAASFQFRFGLGWFRRAIALSGERGVGPDPFFLSGWGHLPPFNKRALRCLCLNRTPPPTHFIGSGGGECTPKKAPPSFPSPISLVGVGAAVRQRSSARKTTIWCAAHPPLLPHLFSPPTMAALGRCWVGLCVCALGENDDYTPPPSIRISRPLHDARGVQRSVGWWGTLFYLRPMFTWPRERIAFIRLMGLDRFSASCSTLRNYVLLVAPHPPCLGGSGIPKSESPPIQLPPPSVFLRVSSP